VPTLRHKQSTRLRQVQGARAGKVPPAACNIEPGVLTCGSPQVWEQARAGSERRPRRGRAARLGVELVFGVLCMSHASHGSHTPGIWYRKRRSLARRPAGGRAGSWARLSDTRRGRSEAGEHEGVCCPSHQRSKKEVSCWDYACVRGAINCPYYCISPFRMLGSITQPPISSPRNHKIHDPGPLSTSIPSPPVAGLPASQPAQRPCRRHVRA
jgi:hypothetical protein